MSKIAAHEHSELLLSTRSATYVAASRAIAITTGALLFAVSETPAAIAPAPPQAAYTLRLHMAASGTRNLEAVFQF